jgi:hypothetical protein
MGYEFGQKTSSRIFLKLFDGTASEYQRPAQDHECEKGERRKPVLHDKKIVRAMEQGDQ